MINIPFWLLDLAKWLPIAVMIVATGISMYTDLKWRRILNKVTFATFFAGIAWSMFWILFYTVHLNAWSMTTLFSVLTDIGIVFAIGFGSFYIMYMMGGMGAGDVKLLGALSLWVFPWHSIFAMAMGETEQMWAPWQSVVWLVALIAIAGGLFAIYYIRKAKLGREAIQYVKMGGKVQLDLLDHEKTYIPYGVPIAIGTLAFILFIWL